MPTQLLMKPLFGPLFGEGQYALASVASVQNGLHAVKFMVVQPASGNVLSVAGDKGEALSAARRLLAALGDYREAANDLQYRQQPTLFEPDQLPIPAAPTAMVSRRRREIHARTAGLCFYCDAPLAVEGPWHVEHQLPRSLGGTGDAMNLVAACPTCNLRKGDRTAIEFLVEHDG